MKYLKKFKTNTDYFLYKNSDEYITPNVCLIETTDEMYFKSHEPIIAVRFRCDSDKENIITINIAENQLMIPGVFSSQDRPNLSRFVNRGYFSVIFEDSITSIGSDAFLGTGEILGPSKTLMDVRLGKNITSIGNQAFKECVIRGWNINMLGSCLTTIGDSAFESSHFKIEAMFNDQQPTLYDFTIPEGVTTIGNYAFKNVECYGFALMEEMWLPSTVTTIGEGLFMGSRFSNTFVLPNSLTTVPAETFMGCDYSRAVIYGANVTQKTITCGGETININNVKVDGIIISDSVTTIGNNAFKGLFNARYFMGNTIERLGDGFGEILIGNGVTSIGSDAFVDVPSTTVVCFATTPPALAIGLKGELNDPFPYWDYDDGENPVIRLLKIYVPGDNVNAYKTAWPHLADYIFAI